MFETVRTRSWALAAIAGVMASTGAVAVSVRASATQPATGSTYVPMVPCRLFDTRPGPEAVGDRLTPIEEEETVTQQVVGDVGNCSVPADAVSVAINLTAVNGTAASFLTASPAGEGPVLASTLNWLPGSPPLPNQVVVGLSTDGAIDLFNRFGSVDVLGDVVGYNTSADLELIETRLDQLEIDAVGIADEFNTLDDAVTLKADLDDVYTKDVADALHRGVPSMGGYINVDGTVSDHYLRFGSFSVSHQGLGSYRISDIGRGSCVGRDRPLIVVTADAAANGNVFVSCDAPSGNFQAYVDIRGTVGITDGTLVDEPFNFVWIDG